MGHDGAVAGRAGDSRFDIFGMFLSGTMLRWPNCENAVTATNDVSAARTATALALCLTVLALAPLPALAYIGPGAGISFFGSILGILATIFVAVGAILLWPVRRMMKRRKAAKAADSAAGPESTP